jgi:hypothetical protein
LPVPILVENEHLQIWQLLTVLLAIQLELKRRVLLAGPLFFPLACTRANIRDVRLYLKRGQDAMLEGILYESSAGDSNRVQHQIMPNIF